MSSSPKVLDLDGCFRHWTIQLQTKISRNQRGGGGGVGGQTRVDLATLAFFPVFCRVFWARKRRKSHENPLKCWRGQETIWQLFSFSGVSQTIVKQSTWEQCPQVLAGKARKVAKSTRLCSYTGGGAEGCQKNCEQTLCEQTGVAYSTPVAHKVLHGAPLRGGTTLLHFSRCSRPFIQNVRSTLSCLKSCNSGVVRGTPSSTAQVAQRNASRK